jgi:large subunit ribosomal protein L30
MKKKISSTTVKVQQIGSPIRREAKQKLHLKALGLGKMNATRELVDTPEVQGLIRKVRHMVHVVSE